MKTAFMDIIPYAENKALQLAKQPPDAVRLSKSLLKKASLDIIVKVMADEIDHFIKRLQTAEFSEAVTNFFNKRKSNLGD